MSRTPNYRGFAAYMVMDQYGQTVLTTEDETEAWESYRGKHNWSLIRMVPEAIRVGQPFKADSVWNKYDPEGITDPLKQ